MSAWKWLELVTSNIIERLVIVLTAWLAYITEVLEMAHFQNLHCQWITGELLQEQFCPSSIELFD